MKLFFHMICRLLRLLNNDFRNHKLPQQISYQSHVPWLNMYHGLIKLPDIIPVRNSFLIPYFPVTLKRLYFSFSTFPVCKTTGLPFHTGFQKITPFSQFKRHSLLSNKFIIIFVFFVLCLYSLHLDKRLLD